MQVSNPERLLGLDLARLIALLGMIIVNFNIVMLPTMVFEQSTGLVHLLQGRAAATFVILAGIGFGLMSRGKTHAAFVRQSLKRVVFLLLLGLLNLLFFPADIIHYYAFYFLLALPLINRSTTTLVMTIMALIAGFVLLLIGLDYDRGWNWLTYEYSGLWTVEGFIRNLLFNGWHPIIPWLAFLLYGLILSRVNLQRTATAYILLAAGLIGIVEAHWLSVFGMEYVSDIDPELPLLFSTEAIPPVPLYLLSAASFANVIIGLCLLLAKPLAKIKVLPFLLPAGRQTLTWYVAHIIMGMGILEALNMLGNQDAKTAWTAITLFSISAIALGYVWSRFFHRGPLETVMRILTR